MTNVLTYLTSLSKVADAVKALLRNLSLFTGSAIDFRSVGKPTTRGGPSVLLSNARPSVYVDNNPAATANVDNPFILLYVLPLKLNYYARFLPRVPTTQIYVLWIDDAAVY